MFKRGTTIINEEEIFYIFEDTGKPKVLFLHGFNSAHSFVFQLEKLENRDYDIVAFDFPGCGKSTANKDVDITYYQQISAKFVELFNLKGSLVVAHSLGAASALYLLDQTLVKYALLGGPLNPFTVDDVLKTRANTLKHWLLPKTLKDAIESSKNLVFGNKNNYKDQLKKIGSMFLKLTQIKYKLFSFMVNKQILNSKWLKENLEPLYANNKNYEIISGRQDLFVPLESLEQVQNKYHISLSILEECGHALFFEQSEKINEKINELVAKIMPDAGLK